MKFNLASSLSIGSALIAGIFFGNIAISPLVGNDTANYSGAAVLDSQPSAS